MKIVKALSRKKYKWTPKRMEKLIGQMAQYIVNLQTRLKEKEDDTKKKDAN